MRFLKGFNVAVKGTLLKKVHRHAITIMIFHGGDGCSVLVEW